ncbi:MAG: XRE family transcriptional regulator [Victivallaceae bacterium]|nr:XRE family transcriptional regulator [Victivallaceae bacterium]
MKEESNICDFGILRDLRKREKLSIQSLSEKSGVSASVISKLERNRTDAEIDTLYRIARVFGMTLTDLISLAENRTSHMLKAEEYRSGDFRFSRISYANMRCMHAYAEAGSELSNPEVHRDDYELCWVIRGHLKFTLQRETYDLLPGTSIQFDALLPHTYEAQEDSELFIVHLRKDKRF